MAESVLRHLTVGERDAPQHQWLIDSAALADWNVGRLPEPRAVQVLAAHGLHSDHIARQVRRPAKFIYIYVNPSIYLTYFR